MSLLTGYVVLLAALPAIGFALRMIRFLLGHQEAIVGYVTVLAVYFAGTFLLQVLSKNFGGNGDLAQAAKTIAYSMTAGCAAGIATFIPFSLGMLISLAGGIYSLYLLYLALPVFMDVPQDKVVGLEVIFVVALIIVGFAITFLLSSILAVGYYTSPLARY